MTESAWPSPRLTKSWTDSDGKVWRRIGDYQWLGKNAVRRLIHDPSVRVVLFDGPEPREVSFEARESLWRRMEFALRSPFNDFVSYKFRDGDGNAMLAIEEQGC